MVSSRSDQMLRILPNQSTNRSGWMTFRGTRDLPRFEASRLPHFGQGRPISSDLCGIPRKKILPASGRTTFLILPSIAQVFVPFRIHQSTTPIEQKIFRERAKLALLPKLFSDYYYGPSPSRPTEMSSSSGTPSTLEQETILPPSGTQSSCKHIRPNADRSSLRAQQILLNGT
ncbi:uncharacterized protein LY89DRAFT_200632 [Mollisia scopiformis]|uniref:Uncharacterized protein n=1 Tax=Mollisia scopiformis TaxID=149040 RepID=A0A194WYN9_MOLSC|nr:uncharacterized protein LY89DRAFT_200632 [Mollisia scopiformis]KUJ13078.1 hypothetical protein LY89DRAFT_200632 [Mollisia scopiformis]